MQAEFAWIFSHHSLRFLKGEVGRIVSASPRIMERSLVATYIYVYAFVGKSFPKVYHISYISHRYRALSLHALAYGRNQFVEIIMKLVYPTLVVAFLCSQWIYLSHNTHHASYVASFRLCARHATKPRRHEEHAVDILTFALGL